ncbi:MAG: NADH dehydrogenase 1 alpha subcomplex assembly factor 3 [Piptocephalis tieghemiana]|nr:MAG: NADH dehydrogenase 1 alpha subcomplex assembly factor 3 [Piptocephalis tieghemiana]
MLTQIFYTIAKPTPLSASVTRCALTRMPMRWSSGAPRNLFDEMGVRSPLAIRSWTRTGFVTQGEGGEKRHTGALLIHGNVPREWREAPKVSPEGGWKGWDASDFELILQRLKPKPDVLILGTGRTLVPPSPPLRKALLASGISTEVLSTRHACDTFNVLQEEGRVVSAALLPMVPESGQE